MRAQQAARHIGDGQGHRQVPPHMALGGKQRNRGNVGGAVEQLGRSRGVQEVIAQQPHEQEHEETAGAALLDTCKEVKGKDPVQIGSYRGFTMSVAFDSMWKTYTLTLKGRMTHRVELGSDARGNLVRIENALDKMPERLRSVQEQLENLYNQQAAAKAEVGKPFPQEQELAAKTARLIELDMELNLDGKGQPQPEQAIAKSARPSVLDRLKAPPVHGTPEKPHKKEMEAR